MANNRKTPGSGKPRALENVASQADTFSLAPQLSEIQQRYLLQRFALSPAYASILAPHVYGTSETWRATPWA